MAETDNLKLVLPRSNEYVDVEVLNENFRKIDAAVKSLSSAEEYSSAKTYALGDYCTHDGKLYRCTTAITAAEAWTAAHWTETSVSAELKAIYTALAKKTEITLLWGNASPTSTFANQTISLDLSGYDAVIVNLNHSNGIPAVQSSIFVPTSGGEGCLWDSYSDSQNYRIFAVDRTGVFFTQSTSDGFGIPKQIYGIKNVG